MWKNVMYIQYTVPGYEPTTHDLSKKTTRPELPPAMFLFTSLTALPNQLSYF